MRKLIAVLAFALLPIDAAHAQPFCPGVAPWVFADVSASHAFCTYVTWMAQNNVTLGCRVIDANTREYCPDDYVTRLQMAAFMNRLGNALFPLTCAPGQVMKWNGLAWACSDDNIGGSGGGGTVISVAAGTGLTATPSNPITGAGVINLALGYQLPQSCANGQVPKSNGTGGWTCGADNAGTGTVTSLSQGTGITLTPSPITTTGTIAVNTTTIQARVTGTCPVGNYVRAIAADGTVTCGADSGGAANAYVQSGNAFGAPAVLGTTDNNALDVRVNNARVMRFEPNAISPNVIGGSPANNVTAGVRGATIGGGGVPAGDTDPNFNFEAPNRVTDAYGTVGGGYANLAGNDTGNTVDAPFATVGGGWANVASGLKSTVGGGGGNAAFGSHSTVGGGENNAASGLYSTVGGGLANNASGTQSTIGGGVGNDASGALSTVGGGHANRASGSYSTVPGGAFNLAHGDYSFAAGARARASHNNSFVWGGSTTIETNSIADGDFVVYAPTAIRMFAGAPGSGGCTLTSGAGWACASDRTLKSDVAPVDATAVLEQLAALPIARWSFTSVPGTTHMGPMAQDFHAAFKLGDDATRLAPMDVQGVALAAIQGLNAKLASVVADKDAEIAALKERLAKVETSHARDMADLRLAFEVLMAQTSPERRVAQGR